MSCNSSLKHCNRCAASIIHQYVSVLTSLRLPEEIAAMESLQRLDLSNNHLLGYVCSVYSAGNAECVHSVYSRGIVVCSLMHG